LPRTVIPYIRPLLGMTWSTASGLKKDVAMIFFSCISAFVDSLYNKTNLFWEET